MQGLTLSYEYFAKHDVPHKKVGKLVVAHGDEEVKRLNDLFDRAQKNGCPDIKLVEKDAINQYEPECRVSFYEITIVFCIFENQTILDITSQ